MRSRMQTNCPMAPRPNAPRSFSGRSSRLEAESACRNPRSSSCKLLTQSRLSTRETTHEKDSRRLHKSTLDRAGVTRAPTRGGLDTAPLTCSIVISVAHSASSFTSWRASSQIGGDLRSCIARPLTTATLTPSARRGGRVGGAHGSFWPMPRRALCPENSLKRSTNPSPGDRPLTLRSELQQAGPSTRTVRGEGAVYRCVSRARLTARRVSSSTEFARRPMGRR